MEYHLKSLEHNTLKGIIGEQLARSFIRNHLAPQLMEQENWNHILLSNNDYKQHRWTWSAKLFKYDAFREDFIVHGFYANTRLLSKYAMVVSELFHNHCTPDGILFKLKDTGKTNRVKEDACPSITKLRVKPDQNCDGIFELPEVSGDLEIIEIKCGRKAKLMDKQKETYNDLIAKDVPLRIIRVRIVSFDLNRFLVEQELHDRFI